ncbi:hypothetical protein KC963_02020 [Candidatus Saccharibacteria bacterium]|nr:hypothetical protein [Candidatus Saccharibacteria bacterium]
MRYIGFPLPKVWVTIRESLEQLRISGHNYISYDHYLKLCAQYNIEEDRALFLSDFFHDLGVFLHFRDDLVLADTIFLNHEWVTDGVYKVLDDAKIKAEGGRFDNRDLINIWCEEKYRGKREELLALMKNRKFEICYELYGGGYLAPQLLPVDEHRNIRERRDIPGSLHFEYRYHFMPKGILTRLIVKRHKEIYEHTQWRYGVFLKYEGTYALVRERYFERKLTIVLDGYNKQDFLAIIRSTIQEIHNTFNNLKVEERIPCNCAQCRKSQERHFYKYDLLKRYLRAGKSEIICEQSLEAVGVQALISDIMSPRDKMDISEQGNEIHVHGNYYQQQITTGGGAVVGGDVNTHGGDFTGREKSIKSDQ